MWIKFIITCCDKSYTVSKTITPPHFNNETTVTKQLMAKTLTVSYPVR